MSDIYSAPFEETSAAIAAESVPEEQRPVSKLFVTLYTGAMLGIWMAINIPAAITIALRVEVVASPDDKANVFSWVLGLGILCALLANPIFGRLSDRTRSRFGRRRPWVLGGLAGATVGATIIGLTDTVPLLMLGWCVMQAGTAAALAALTAIVGDRVPERQQGVVGAMSGAAGAASTVLGVLFVKAFPTQILPQIGLPIVAAIVLAGLFVAFYREDRPADAGMPKLAFGDIAASFAINPRRSPDFVKFLVGLFLFAWALGVTSSYTVYFLQDQLQIPDEQFTDVLFWSLLVPGTVALVVAPLAGWVGDKIGRRKPLMVAAALVGAGGIIVIVLAQSVAMFLVGMILVAGIATGISYGAYIALAIGTIVDPSNMARDLGLVNIAFTLPFALVPLVAPLLLSVGGNGANYVLLYLVAGAVSLCSIAVILSIRNTR